MAWDRTVKNDWTKASSMTLLNSGDYWNRTGTYASTGLTEESKSQIADAKWYLGGTDQYKTTNVEQFYSYERGTTVYTGNPSWVGKVGLMYPSDYGFATSGGVGTDRHECFNKEMYEWNAQSFSDCKNNDWLFFDGSSRLWTITPNSGVPNNVYAVYSSGNVGHVLLSTFGVTSELYPSVYLKSDIKISGGDGRSAPPYEISK